MEGTKCKTCGHKVAFVQDTEGKTQIVDLVAPTYQVVTVDGKPMARRTRDVFVSHFATCPQASQHSQKSGTKATRVCAVGDTFDHKETLKSLGFRWDGRARAWAARLPDERIDEVAAEVKERCPGVRVRCDV